MANRWGNSGWLYFSGLQNHCSHETERLLLLGREDQPRQHIKRQTLPTKVSLVKAMVFPVVMYGCESWTIKKAEHWRIDAFKLWCWRRLLRVPWTAKRSNQSILKEINPEYSLDGLMLKLQYSDHLNRKKRADSFEKTLTLGKIEGRKRRGQQRMRWLDGITESMDMSLSKLWSWWWTEKPGVLQSMESQRVRHDWVTELNWKSYEERVDCLRDREEASVSGPKEPRGEVGVELREAYRGKIM